MTENKIRTLYEYGQTNSFGEIVISLRRRGNESPRPSIPQGPAEARVTPGRLRCVQSGVPEAPLGTVEAAGGMLVKPPGSLTGQGRS